MRLEGKFAAWGPGQPGWTVAAIGILYSAASVRIQILHVYETSEKLTDKSMHYHQSMIYAHRPWMSKHALQPQPPRGPGYQHAREMCVQSAIAISKLLALYEHHYDLRRIHHNAVHIASSAALLLGFADMCLFPERENESIKACLSTCFRALEELSASWKNATQVVDALVRIQRKWRDRRATAGPVFAANGFDNAPTTDSLQSVSHVDFGLPDESGWMGPHDSALFDFDFDWPYLAEDQV